MDIGGQVEAPYFSTADLETVSSAILKIARDPKTAREKAIRLIVDKIVEIIDTAENYKGR